MYLTTEDPLRAMLQCQYGETATEVDSIPVVEAVPNPRLVRNQLLTDCDWTQMPDNGMEASLKEAWRVYRQALRDMDFDPPSWPSPPG